MFPANLKIILQVLTAHLIFHLILFLYRGTTAFFGTPISTVSVAMADTGIDTKRIAGVRLRLCRAHSSFASDKKPNLDTTTFPELLQVADPVAMALAIDTKHMVEHWIPSIPAFVFGEDLPRVVDQFQLRRVSAFATVVREAHTINLA